MNSIREYMNYKHLIIALILVVFFCLFLVLIFANPNRDLKTGYMGPGKKADNLNLQDTFSRTYPEVMIQNLWLAYKDKIQKDGRTIDRSNNFITTSEGQSYSLLRAVWMDDQETFDRVLKWTNNNLRKRKEDKLFAWSWGERKDNTWDVMEDGGINTASDADQDIALALIFAHKRWNQEFYIDQARQILNDIWSSEVLIIGDEHYMLAGNWAMTEEFPTLNPSYLSFAAYNIFADVDKTHPWVKVKDTSYKVLFAASKNNLDKSSSVNLPPDWVSLDRKSGEILPIKLENKSTHFSDDAFRVVWRVALDWYWYEDPRAKEYLKNLTFLNEEWQKNGKIMSQYEHDGELSSDHESNSLYGGVLPLFKILWPETAMKIYEQKLVSLYNSGLEDFAYDIGYYAQNWVWFGMAFYNNKLVNLYTMIE